MFGSRTLSLVSMKAMSSYIEDIDLFVMHTLFLIIDLQVRAKTILDQINFWIKSIEGFQDLEDLQTFEIDECARLLILLPTLQQCASSEQYDMIVTSHFCGNWLLQRAIESERNSTVYNLVHLLRTKNYKLLEWEMQHLVSTHKFFSKIAPKILPCLSFFIRFYRKIGWYPKPLDFNKGLDIFHFILELYSFFHKSSFETRSFQIVSAMTKPDSSSHYRPSSLNLETEDRNAYLNFLKKYGWDNGLLFDACKTGKHENIIWSIDFLKRSFVPRLLWEIEPLSLGENTIVTVLMSSGKTDQDIYRGLLKLIQNLLPFDLLWDNFSSENCPISWIAKSQITESEKQNFNRIIIKYYSKLDVMGEVVFRYDPRDAVVVLKNFAHYNVFMPKGSLSKKRRSFLFYETCEDPFRGFVDIFIWYLFQNLTDITTGETNEENCIPIDVILELLLLTEKSPSELEIIRRNIDPPEKFGPMKVKRKTRLKVIFPTEKTQLAMDDTENPYQVYVEDEIELIERKWVEIYRIKDFEKYKNISSQNVSSDLLDEYTSQLGIQHGILNTAYSLKNMDFLFGCIRKLLQAPNILNLELKLFHNNCQFVRHNRPGRNVDKKIKTMVQTLFDCREGSQPITFFFDAEALSICLYESLLCNSFNFLYLILYTGSHLLPFKQYIGYDPDLSVDDKILTHKHCLDTKFCNRGLLYRACKTLQPDNIKWAIAFLGSIDNCLVKAEMTKTYQTRDTRITLVINMLLSFWYRDQATEENAGTNFDGPVCSGKRIIASL